MQAHSLSASISSGWTDPERLLLLLPFVMKESSAWRHSCLPTLSFSSCSTGERERKHPAGPKHSEVSSAYIRSAWVSSWLFEKQLASLLLVLVLGLLHARDHHSISGDVVGFYVCLDSCYLLSSRSVFLTSVSYVFLKKRSKIESAPCELILTAHTIVVHSHLSQCIETYSKSSLQGWLKRRRSRSIAPLVNVPPSLPLVT